MKQIKLLLFILSVVFSNSILAQSIYKTPSGKKYHLASCRMVNNVSKKISKDEISLYHLKPCKICKPPTYGLHAGYRNKSVGKSSSVRCKGRTKRGT